MALTRRFLNALGIEAEKVDQIIEAHSEAVESLKAQKEEALAKAEAAEKEAEKVPQLEERIHQLESAQPTEDWQAKHEALKAEFDAYKDEVANGRAAEEKARLYRSLLREQGVAEKHIDSIMKVTDLAGISVEDGAIADKDAVAEAIASEWGDFIPTTVTTGARVDNPPSNVGGKPTKEEILAIKDTQARQRAIAENIEAFE